MVKKIIEADIGIELSEERKNGDSIFNTLEFGSLNAIEGDLEYKRPSVKTWMYTNIANRDVWMTESFIPVKIPVNKDILVRLHKFEKCVVIIKTFDFKFKNKGEYALIVKNLITEVNMYGNIRQDIIDKLLSYKDGLSEYGVNERIRLVYTIKEDDILDSKVVRIDGMLFSTDEPATDSVVKNIKSHYELNKDKEFNVPYNPNTEIHLTFLSHSGKDLRIDFLGKPIKLCNRSNNPNGKEEDPLHDIVNVSVTQAGRGGYLGTFTRGDLVLKNKIHANNESVSELASLQAGLRKQAIDTLNNKLASNLQVDKFMLEHSISLHKLFSYIVRDETAMLALEKEEVSTAKEFIKLLGSIK